MDNTIIGNNSDNGYYLPHQYETIKGVRTKEELVDLTKYNWYHGNLTEDEAEVTFNLSGCNGNYFFVRQDPGNGMMLSRIVKGWKSHNKILHSPEGVHLKGEKESFKSIPKMIAHYQLNQKLGKPMELERQVLGILSNSIDHSDYAIACVRACMHVCVCVHVCVHVCVWYKRKS